ncbi:MAG: pyridoxal phosphate-dependent aminotransferase [Sporolactobacillus sp.]
MVVQEQQLAGWVNRISTSPTAQLEARVEMIQRQGAKIYRFGLGLPDFNTPDCAKQAAIEAIDQNKTTYTDTAGILPLREAVCRHFFHTTGITYSSDEIVVSVGGKQALFNAICTLCDHDDEVLIPIPYWVSYEAQVKFTGATPVLVPTSENSGFKVTKEQLEEKVTSRTKVLILNSPNNPTGAVYTADELAGIADFCRQNDLWVISDEVYSSYLYDDRSFTSVVSFEGMKERTIVVNAVSKTFGMTGWRIGYAAAPQRVAEAMIRLQSHSTSNPTSIAQWGALAALNAPTDVFHKTVDDYQKRRDFIVDYMDKLNGFRCRSSEGAFYLWVDITQWIGKTLAGRIIRSADDLAQLLLDTIHVAVMPGNGFGSPNHLRFSFSLPMDEIKEGLSVLEKFLKVNENKKIEEII